MSQKALQSRWPRTPRPRGPNSSEEGSRARGFLGMEHGASAGPRSGLPPRATAGSAHTGPAVSPGRQQPHAPGSDDGRGPEATRPGLHTARCHPRALVGQASRAPTTSSARRSRRARRRHPHWTAAPGRSNQRARNTLAGAEARGRWLGCVLERGRGYRRCGRAPSGS